MKKAIQIFLGFVILGLGALLLDQIFSPIKFQQEVSLREQAVIEKIKDIRAAERAFKQKHQRYTGNFDSLINFVLNDSLTFERAIGSADDSVAVAKGLVKKERFQMAVRDTIFGAKKLTLEQIKSFALVPFSVNEEHPQGQNFILAACLLETESKVTVPVFECKAPYKMFLYDLNRQLLVNLIDEKVSLRRYPGIKVGSMEQATNDAGNWE